MFRGTSQKEETSKFTANIDKAWIENGVDENLKVLHSTEEDLAEIKAEMLNLYGENKEINSDYDESLVAKPCRELTSVKRTKIMSFRGRAFPMRKVEREGGS